MWECADVAFFKIHPKQIIMKTYQVCKIIPIAVRGGKPGSIYFEIAQWWVFFLCRSIVKMIIYKYILFINKNKKSSKLNAINIFIYPLQKFFFCLSCKITQGDARLLFSKHKLGQSILIFSFVAMKSPCFIPKREIQRLLLTDT